MFIKSFRARNFLAGVHLISEFLRIIRKGIRKVSADESVFSLSKKRRILLAALVTLLLVKDRRTE